MKSIFDEEVRREVLTRLNALTPTSRRRWGKMGVEQMLDHLNNAYDAYMGKLGMDFHGNPLLAKVSKFLTFTPIPIPRGWVRIPEQYESAGAYSFEQEKQRFLELTRDFIAKQDNWPRHIFLNTLTREEYGKLTYKHIDHHFRQFGV